MSPEELELVVAEISQCLEMEGYHPLPKREMRDRGLFSSEDLVLLEEQGLIFIQKALKPEQLDEEKDEEVSEEAQEYDVVQALLSSPQASYEPLSHIQTTEAGRFRAKH